jgi:biopolymer transport protein TolR
MALQTHNRQRPIAEINIIPLVDVMLVLLIVFMITAPLLQQSIDIDLPQATLESGNAASESFFITLNKDGKIYLPGSVVGQKSAPLTMSTVETKLAEIYATRPDKSIYLQADKDISYGLIVDLMSTCKKAGIERIGLITVPEVKPE